MPLFKIRNAAQKHLGIYFFFKMSYHKNITVLDEVLAREQIIYSLRLI